MAPNFERKIREYPAPYDGGPPTIEYILPISVTDIQDSHRDAIKGWHQRFIGRMPGEIHGMLKKDWAEFEGSAAIFRDYVLSHVPRSLILGYGTFRLGMENNDLCMNHLMISEPTDLNAAQVELIQDFKSCDSLEVFCSHFSDLYHDLTPHNRSFGVTAFPITADMFPNCGPWEHGLSLCHNGCGDAMLLSREGIVARWNHEVAYKGVSHAIREVFGDFAPFIESYVGYATGTEDEQRTSVFHFG